ncbi:hypothetical protein ABK040_010207 [Willaertia magna]
MSSMVMNAMDTSKKDKKVEEKKSNSTSKRKVIKIDENTSPEQALVEYIKLGQVEDVEELFQEYNIDPDLEIKGTNHGSSGSTEVEKVIDYPITLAVKLGHCDIVNVLVENRADFNITINGDTGLHIATNNKDENMIKTLLAIEVVHPSKKGVIKRMNVDCIDDKGLRPIDIAFNNYNASIVKLLMENGSSLDFEEIRSESNLTILHEAAAQGDVKRLTFLNELGQSPYKRDINSGKTILHYAVANNKKDVIEYYLKMKFDLSLLYSEDVLGRTPIDECCSTQNWELLKLLITKCNADVNYIAKDGLTLINRYSYLNNMEIVDKLIGLKAKPNTTDRFGNTAIHWAVSANSKELVKYFMDKKLSVNDQNLQGNTCLHICAYIGNLEIAELILSEKKVVVNQLNNQKRTPLQEAASRGHVALIELLINKGANIHQEDNNGMTALQIALNEEQQDTALVLLRFGSNVDRKFVGYVRDDTVGDSIYALSTRGAIYKAINPGYNTILQQAICCKYTEVVKEMTKKKELKLEERDENGFTPLLNAIKIQNIEMVDFLLRAGADVNAFDEKGKNSPILLASALGNVDICNLLLSNKASLNEVSDVEENKSALHNACKNGSIEVVKKLLENEANISATDKYNRTPLFDACEKDRPEICELLMEKGSNVDHTDKEGFTSLHLSCLSGSVLCVKALLKFGAKLNTKDGSGRTPLILASQAGSVEVAKLLIKASHEIKNNNSNG